MRAFFLNREVIVVDDLNSNFEFIKLGLHQLLRAKSEELQVKFCCSGLHDLLAFFDVLLFALLHDFPKFVR